MEPCTNVLFTTDIADRPESALGIECHKGGCDATP
jgi:hypothetical protein